MCTIWVTDSSDFYSHYEKDLISGKYKDATVEEMCPRDVLTRIETETPDAIVLDNRLPFMSGESLVNKIKECSPDTKIVVVSSDRRGLSKIKDRVVSVLDKPLKAANFMTVIGQIYNGS